MNHNPSVNARSRSSEAIALLALTVRIDIFRPQEHFGLDMKFLFRHLLLLGVILGLAGPSLAFASPPCAMMEQEQPSAMAGAMAGMPDCAMGQHKSDKGSTPCKDMGTGCLAMAGCSAMLGLDTPSVEMALPLTHSVAAIGAEHVALIGRSDPPDPYPPSLLG